MNHPDEVREQAFEAGVKTRGAVENMRTTANKVENKVSKAIGSTIDNVQGGFKDGIGAAADSAAQVTSSVLQNKRGKRAAIASAFGLTVLFFGFMPALSFFGSIGGGVVAGGASGRPLNSDNKVANFSSYLGSGVNRVVLVGGQAIGEAASSAYQYQPVTTQQAPTGGSIRAGSINPFPQPPVVRVQMQQPNSQHSIAVNQNANGYQPRR